MKVRGFVDAEPSPDGRNDYKRFKQRLLTRGDYLVIPRAWLLAFGPAASCLIAHVVSLGAERADAAGWLMATEAFMENGLGLDADSQTKVLDQLARLGVASAKMRGSMRYLRVDVRKLREVLRQGKKAA